jgi:protein-S-isoprenylcysteine O-methyltransferase
MEEMKLPSAGMLGLAYLISEVLLAVTKRSRAGSTGKDANSLRLLWVVIGVSIYLALTAIHRWPDATLPHRQSFAALGVVLFVLGVALRWYSIIHLGRFFTVDVAIAKDHQLVETGPYRVLRHPSYTGALVAFVGWGLSLGNWGALLVMIVPIFFAFVYRMNVEETALLAGLGAPYASYSRRTKRLIPFVY